MENSNFLIRIPEPCHEDWNSMQPDPKGKFCGSCSKSVFDFSNKTDSEIRDILIEYKDQKVCGHFKKTQVNRPFNISINLSDLPKNVSTTKVFAIALFLVFGTFLFSCTNLQGKKVDGIEIVDPKDGNYVVGEMAAIPINTLTIDTISQIDPISTTSISETHISGGVSIEQVPVIEEVTPQVENYILGQMMVVANKVNDSTINNITDTSFIKDTDRSNDRSLLNKQTDLTFFPNPSNGEFTIKYTVLKRANVQVDVYDLNGALLKTLVNISDQFEGNYNIPVNLNELPNGIYLVSLINNGKRFTERVVIEK